MSTVGTPGPLTVPGGRWGRRLERLVAWLSLRRRCSVDPYDRAPDGDRPAGGQLGAALTGDLDGGALHGHAAASCVHRPDPASIATSPFALTVTFCPVSSSWPGAGVQADPLLALDARPCPSLTISIVLAGRSSRRVSLPSPVASTMPSGRRRPPAAPAGGRYGRPGRGRRPGRCRRPPGRRSSFGRRVLAVVAARRARTGVEVAAGEADQHLVADLRAGTPRRGPCPRRAARPAPSRWCSRRPARER